MLMAGDAQTIAAIASEFMADGRYQEWYDREKDGRSGTPGIWCDLGWVGVQVVNAEKALDVDWCEYEFIEAIDSIVDRMYTTGLEQDWKVALKEILDEQKNS